MNAPAMPTSALVIIRRCDPESCRATQLAPNMRSKIKARGNADEQHDDKADKRVRVHKASPSGKTPHWRFQSILAERWQPGNRHPAHHSSLAPERLITSAHLAESVLIVAANSSGVPPPGSSPILANFSLKASDASTLLIAALSLST